MRFPGLIVAALVVYIVLGALAKPAAAVWSAAVSAVHWISIVLLWGGVAAVGVAAVVVTVRVGRWIHAAVAKNASPRSPRQMPTALAAAAYPGVPATPPVLLPDRTNGPAPSQQVAPLVVVPAPTLPEHAALRVSSAQGWSPPNLAPPTADEQLSVLPPLITPATPDIAPADTEPPFVLPGFADQGQGIEGAAVAQGPWQTLACTGFEEQTSQARHYGRTCTPRQHDPDLHKRRRLYRDSGDTSEFPAQSRETQLTAPHTSGYS